MIVRILKLNICVVKTDTERKMKIDYKGELDPSWTRTKESNSMQIEET